MTRAFSWLAAGAALGACVLVVLRPRVAGGGAGGRGPRRPGPRAPAAGERDADGYLWACGPVKCLVCQHRWTAQYSEDHSPFELACPTCGHALSDPE